MQNMDNPAYEYALGTVPARYPDDEEQEDLASNIAIAARMARMLVRHILASAGNDARSCMMMLQRSAGMTLAEIGMRHGVTKQAVYKRFAKIVARHPEMEEYLQLSKADRLDEAVSGPAELLEIRNRQHRKMKELSNWVYGGNSDKC